jgi:hypothetical protein
MVAKKKAAKGKGQAKRKAVRNLSPKASSQVRGGGKRKDGTGGGNVAGGWDLIGNKVNA